MVLNSIVLFQEHLNELDQLVREMVANYTLSKVNARGREKIRHLVLHTDLLVSWANALPLDDEFWIYSRPYDFFHRIRSYQSDLLQDLERFRNVADIEVMRQHVLAARTIMDDLRTAAAEILNSANYEGLSHICPPWIIISELCLNSYGQELMQLPTEFQIQEWPAVIYHPLLPGLLRSLADLWWLLRRNLPVHISVRKTPDCCEIALTAAGLHLRPDMWDLIVHRPDFSGPEMLRSIGGQIEPLVWHDELGDGLIVRLPWVEGSHEKVEEDI